MKCCASRGPFDRRERFASYLHRLFRRKLTIAVDYRISSLATPQARRLTSTPRRGPHFVNLRTALRQMFGDGQVAVPFEQKWGVEIESTISNNFNTDSSTRPRLFGDRRRSVRCIAGPKSNFSARVGEPREQCCFGRLCAFLRVRSSRFRQSIFRSPSSSINECGWAWTFEFSIFERSDFGAGFRDLHRVSGYDAGGHFQLVRNDRRCLFFQLCYP